MVANVKHDTVSDDEHSALVQFDLTGDPHTAIDRVQPTLDATKAVAARHPGFAVEQFGTRSMTKQLDDANAKEESASNQRSLDITLLILALTFGALVAASVPVILAVHRRSLGTTGVDRARSAR